MRLGQFTRSYIFGSASVLGFNSQMEINVSVLYCVYLGMHVLYYVELLLYGYLYSVLQVRCIVTKILCIYLCLVLC